MKGKRFILMYSEAALLCPLLHLHLLQLDRSDNRTRIALQNLQV